MASEPEKAFSVTINKMYGPLFFAKGTTAGTIHRRAVQLCLCPKC